ncbi:hypothetical protein AB7M45_002291 [Bradyrhizobium elkanii]|uniref:hypothetical protein n=1 Tax=Bradyrhizobium TaxID=374 RepID=UPI00030BFA30|nr:hypothetical protein [Bradyrhizobium elkanii]MCW2189521.1 hypothetical protein [Bradyrhizobium elkanii]
MPRSDVFVQAAGGTNSAGTRPACSEAKTAPEEHEEVGGLRVSVDFHGEDSERIAEP